MTTFAEMDLKKYMELAHTYVKKSASQIELIINNSTKKLPHHDVVFEKLNEIENQLRIYIQLLDL